MNSPLCLLQRYQMPTQLLLWKMFRQLLQQLATHLWAWLACYSLPRGSRTRGTSQVLALKLGKMHTCLLSISQGCRCVIVHPCTLPTSCNTAGSTAGQAQLAAPRHACLVAKFAKNKIKKKSLESRIARIVSSASTYCLECVAWSSCKLHSKLCFRVVPICS